ncbi:unnamed protein product [Linum tenue]|uniref:Major facilitator superfamily (MFS) profile domain-containing protein n=1 Tax=Linum tenue TaxID=586396 RepID=A0AAV0HET6_9ROSI|nr:unnamed protein product [Linum tenue]
MTNYGFAVAFFMGNIISWRTLSLIAVVPCVVQLVGLFFIPESPRWLAKVGREKEVQGALQRLRGKKDIADIFQEADDIRGYVAAFGIGMGGIPWVLMSEILPIDVKASGGSIATLTNWSVSWLITYTFNFALEWNPASTFFFFAAMSLVAVFFTWKLVPETRGRTLEEIQQLCS